MCPEKTYQETGSVAKRKIESNPTPGGKIEDVIAEIEVNPRRTSQKLPRE